MFFLLLVVAIISNITIFRSQESSTSVRYHQDVQVNRLPNNHYSRLRDLVIVPTESAFLANVDGLIDSDEVWKMEHSNANHGLGPLLLNQIEVAVKLLVEDIWDMLLFSGGPVILDAGPMASSLGYNIAASKMKWFGTIRDQVPPRVVTEEFATDEVETLLYSLCRFKELAGHYPEKLRVVDFDFKKERYHKHIQAIKWPIENFKFVSIDTSSYDSKRMKTWKKEEVSLIEMYEKDPYGCDSHRLKERRRGRNLYNRVNGYTTSCPDIASLLQYCGPEIYSQVPDWSSIRVVF